MISTTQLTPASNLRRLPASPTPQNWFSLSTTTRPSLRQLLVLMFAGCLTFGCSPSQEIESHRIPKSQSGLADLRKSNTLPAMPTAQPTRTVVAIFETPDLMWFFKVSGPVEQVKTTEPQWQAFIDHLKFIDNQPTWDVPDGWSTAAPKPMRHTTLVIGETQPPLEFVISNLATGQDMLLNLNRWRRQINLPPATQADVEDHLKKTESDAGVYLRFDQIGTGSGGMRPPFAGGVANSNGATRPPGNASSPSLKLTYDVPEGWSEGKTSAMVPARLVKTVGEVQTQITIVKMPGASNEWKPNAKRWAEQVSMRHLTDDQLAERTSSIKVDGIDGKLIDLSDPDSDSTTSTIAGMVKHDGSAWFIKLSGDKQTVEDSRKIFDQFIQSLRFK